MGLLYGEGDPMKTLEITTRCGADSDCNPSNAMAVLGVIKGFSGLPEEMRKGTEYQADSLFINTTYSFNSAVKSTYNYAIDLILKDGGMVTEKEISVKTQPPVAPKLEVAFPDLVFDKSVSIFDGKAWTFKGKWETYEATSWDDKKIPNQSKFSEKAGDELTINFNGTGISLTGNWHKDGGKADIYLDGKLHRTIDTYYYFANQEHTEIIWHAVNLQPGDHTMKLVVKGEKRPEATAARVYIVSATIFKTAPKKSESYKFSFEK
jgi:hypothetical protein